MTPPKNNKDERTLPLFDDLGSIEDVEKGIKQIEFRGLQAPVWTSQKAKLIALYLKFFVMITKHGTYIDGFAGPQEPDMPDSWAANLVLNNEPRWLRNFFLCELDKEKVESLKKLAADHPAPRKGQPKRSIKILSGDFNQSIDLALQSGIVTEKEAAFALLDQRTFECHWETGPSQKSSATISESVDFQLFGHCLLRRIPSEGLTRPAVEQFGNVV
ncbi:three-Cys-motif partner protein TcmP [Pandoraea pnomenusa]|uniref:three-Cys-motif partner protein TcmP n=1 Tax=Pandoraea pnomenusa TaxID=93220 RepID=UPI00215D2453|nr:three-Cys-motif partner protein TcmP [Pandoraea pnomenusa]